MEANGKRKTLKSKISMTNQIEQTIILAKKAGSPLSVKEQEYITNHHRTMCIKAMARHLRRAWDTVNLFMIMNDLKPLTGPHIKSGNTSLFEVWVDGALVNEIIVPEGHQDFEVLSFIRTKHADTFLGHRFEIFKKVRSRFPPEEGEIISMQQLKKAQ
jgi:hypothetical protein